MRAAYHVGIGKVEVADAPDPLPARGQVLAQTLAVGICGSDLKHLMRSAPQGTRRGPGEPGHESVGLVLESRSEHFVAGDVVLAVPVSRESAAFAELQAVDARQLIRLPAGLDVAEAVLAQQLGTVIYALGRFWPGPPGKLAVVLGTGGAGLQFVRLLRESGFDEVIASDRSPARLAAALALGASHAVPAGSPELAGLVVELSGGAGADLVVEAAGSDSARAAAAGLIRERGTIGCYGLPEAAGEMLMPFGRLFERQASLLCCVDAQREPGLASFRAAIGAVAAGRAAAAQLISHRLPFFRIDEALQLADGPADGVLKVVVELGSATRTTTGSPAGYVGATTSVHPLPTGRRPSPLNRAGSAPRHADRGRTPSRRAAHSRGRSSPGRGPRVPGSSWRCRSRSRSARRRGARRRRERRDREG